MTVTTNNLGSNSKTITIENELDGSNIISAVNTALTSMGWTLHDTITSGARNCLVTKVYSAPNNDGPSPTTKYMIIRYDAPRQFMYVGCCESWNAGTHIATNESFSGARHIPLSFQFSDNTLYIFANARYACFMSYVRGEPGPWQGIFEFERETSEDAASKDVPCWGWTSSLTIGEPHGTPNTTSNFAVPADMSQYVTTHPAGFSVPRTRNGLLGKAAFNAFVIHTGYGLFPPSRDGGAGTYYSFGTTTAAVLGLNGVFNKHYGMLGAFGTSQDPYAWDTNKKIVSNMKLAGAEVYHPVGKIYGLKVCQPLGSVLDTTTIPVDSNGFFAPNGTDSTHYLLGINGGYANELSVGSNKLVATNTSLSTNLGNMTAVCLVHGRKLYISGPNGLHKLDVVTGVLTALHTASACSGVIFDGTKFIYSVDTPTNSKAIKVDVITDAVTFSTALPVTTANAYGGLAIDDTYLFIAQHDVATAPKVERILLSDFTVQSGFAISPVLTEASGISCLTTGNYDGYVYAAMLAGSTPANCRITRFLASSGAQNSVTPTHAAANSSMLRSFTYFDGQTANFHRNQNSSSALAASSQLLRYDLATGSVSVRAVCIPIQTVYYDWGATITAPNAPAVEIPPFAGMFLIGLDIATTSRGHVLRTVTDNGRLSSAGLFNGNNANAGAGPNLTSEASRFAHSASDGCSTYSPSSQTAITRYTGATRNFNFTGQQTANILIQQ